jgi:hypothetical protein
MIEVKRSLCDNLTAIGALAPSAAAVVVPLSTFVFMGGWCGPVGRSLRDCGQSRRLPSGVTSPELFRVRAVCLVRPPAVMLYDSVGDFVHLIDLRTLDNVDVAALSVRIPTIARALRRTCTCNVLMRHPCDADRSPGIAAPGESC